MKKLFKQATVSVITAAILGSIIPMKSNAEKITKPNEENSTNLVNTQPSLPAPPIIQGRAVNDKYPQMPMPTVEAFSNDDGSGRGYLNVSWEPVEGVKKYQVILFNGSLHSYWDVPADETSFTTRGKGMFPTDEQIESGQVNFKRDGSGTDFYANPSILYKRVYEVNNGGLDYSVGMEYYVRIAAVYEDGASPISYATSSILPYANINLIKSNEVKNVVTVTENDIKTTATYNKLNNELTISSDNKEPIIFDSSDLSKLASILEDDSSVIEYVPSNTSPFIEDNQGLIEARVAKTTENTFSNYEYTITHSSPEKWEIRKPKGKSIIYKEAKKVTYSSSTKSTLNAFKSQVDKINTLEWQMFGSSLTAFGSSVIACILAIPTAGAGSATAALTALGATGTLLNRALALQTATKNARIYFYRL